VSPLQLEIGKVYKDTTMLLDGDKEEEWTFEVRNIQIYFFSNDTVSPPCGYVAHLIFLTAASHL